MPLTPAEVHNVAFKKPPIGKRGYDEEEVDAFLDIVEVELSRLLEENNELKSHPNGAVPSNNGNGGGGGGSGINPAELAAAREDNSRLQARIGELERALSQGKDQTQQQLVQVQQQLAATEQAHAQTRQQLEGAQQAAAQAQEAARAAQQQAAQAVQAAQAAPAQAGPQQPSPDQHAQAIQVLALAQQTAEQHLGQSKAEADRLVTEARQSADAHLTDAQQRAAAHLSEAQARADHLDRDSSGRANQIVQDAEQRANAITSQFEQRKAALERRVEELRTFEREYRTRLKSYLESQLRDLDASGRSDPAAQNDHAGQEHEPAQG
jgi:DivIVA domain-containing protein